MASRRKVGLFWLKAMIVALSAFFCALTFYPIYVLIINTTRSSPEIMQGISMTPSVHFTENIKRIFSLSTAGMNIFRSLTNSLFISTVSPAIATYFGALTAFGLVAYQFKLRRFLTTFIIGLMMFPGVFTMIGGFLYWYRLGLVNTFIPFTVPAVSSAVTVFFMRQYLLSNLHPAIVDAARIDGSHEFITFNRIVLPTMLPVLAVCGITGFIADWNDYLGPLVLLTNPKYMTITIFISRFTAGTYQQDYASAYTGIAVAIIPTIIVYLFLSKFIMAGLTLGAVKE